VSDSSSVTLTSMFRLFIHRFLSTARPIFIQNAAHHERA